MCDLAGEEVEEAFQLVRIAPKRRRQLDRVGVLGRLDCAHVELELVAVALHAAQDAHGVAFGEPAVQEIDIVPDAALDPAAAVDELQREVVGAGPRAQPALAGHRVGALDGRVLCELGYSRHSAESRNRGGW